MRVVFEAFLDDFGVDDFNTIILEADKGTVRTPGGRLMKAPDCKEQCPNYESVKEKLNKRGFKVAVEQQDNIVPHIMHYIFKRTNATMPAPLNNAFISQEGPSGMPE